MTFEGNPIYSRQGTTLFSWEASVADMKVRFTDAVLSKDPDAAEIIIDFWGYSGLFKSMPPSSQDFCRSKAATHLLDWQASARFTPDFTEFAKLTVPSAVVRGELANRSIFDISDRIVANAQNAELHVEPGAGHFLISTHPEHCAAVIDRHMQRFAAMQT